MARPEPLNLNVLIAEDDLIALDIAQAYCESLGCRVQLARNGDQAIMAASDYADWADVIVLDAHMPGPPPAELYEQIRTASPNVPILICSALSEWDSRLDFIAERGLMLLMKPFRRDDLRESILNVLDADLCLAVKNVLHDRPPAR